MNVVPRWPVLAVPDTADASASIELVCGQARQTAGRPESECGTVTSYQRHRAARSKPRRSLPGKTLTRTASTSASERRWLNDHPT